LPPASEDDVYHYGSAGRGSAICVIGEMNVMAKNDVVAVEVAISVTPFH
jgi:hypothetical protein